MGKIAPKTRAKKRVTQAFIAVSPKERARFGAAKIAPKTRAKKQVTQAFISTSPKERARCAVHKAMAKLDRKAAEIRLKVELTEAKMEAVYGDPEIECPSTHPKVKKLFKTLARLKVEAAKLNQKRYEMRRKAKFLGICI